MSATCQTAHATLRSRWLPRAILLVVFAALPACDDTPRYQGWSVGQWKQAALQVRTNQASDRVSEGLQQFGLAAIPDLQRALADGQTCEFASRLLGDFGPVADTSVDSLIDLLGNSDVGVQIEAVRALGNLGQGNPLATAAIAEAARRRMAMPDSFRELGWLGIHALPYLVVPLQALADDDKDTREAAAHCLFWMTNYLHQVQHPWYREQETNPAHDAFYAQADQLPGGRADALDRLRNCLNDDSAQVRRQAAQVLAGIGAADATSTAVLISQLNQDDVDEQLRVLTALQRSGSVARDACMPLFQRLREDSSVAIQAAAAHAIAAIDPTYVDMPTLMVLLHGDAAKQAKVACAEFLRRERPFGADLNEPLRRLLDHELVEVRIAAAEALSKIRPVDMENVTILERLLGDSQPTEVRVAAALSLGQMGAEAAPALSTLVANLSASKYATAAAARWAILRIEAAAPNARATEKGLESRDRYAIVSCARSLETHAESLDEQQVDKLISLLQSSDAHVQVAAARTLFIAGPNIWPKLDALASVLPTSDPTVDAEIASLILNASPLGTLPPSLLIAAMQAETQIVSASAEEGPQLSTPPAQLVRFLNADDAEVRARAAEHLAGWGPVAQDFSEDLLPLLDGPSVEVRFHATTALACSGADDLATIKALARLAENDAERRLRVLAIESLGLSRHRARVAAPVLGRLAFHDDLTTRTFAVWALKYRLSRGCNYPWNSRFRPVAAYDSNRTQLHAEGGWGTQLPGLLTELTSLQADDIAKCVRALAILENSDAPLPATTPYLTTLLTNNDAAIARMAAEALEHVGVRYPDAQRHLEGWLVSQDRWQQILGARTLATVAPESAVLEATLFTWLAGDDHTFGSVATGLLAKIRPHNASAVQRLADLLADSRRSVQVRATRLAACLAPTAPGLASVISHNARNENSDLRLVSLYALAQFESNAVEASLLAACLDDPQPSIQVMACFALERLGIANPQIREKLSALRKETDNDVSKAAKDALEHLQR